MALAAKTKPARRSPHKSRSSVYECGGCKDGQNAADDFHRLISQALKPNRFLLGALLKNFEDEPDKLTMEATAKVSCGLGQRVGAGVSYFDWRKIGTEGEPTAVTALLSKLTNLN